MRLKFDAVLMNLAQFSQTKNLKAAAVRQNRPVPIRKLVQAARLLHQRLAGSEIQMIRVAKNNLRADFFQLQRTQRLHRALRAHRHEHRRENLTVIRRDFAAAGAGVGGLRKNLEFEI